jgi:protein TonB
MAEPLKAPVKPPSAKTTTTPPPQTVPTTKPSTGAAITPGNAVAATTATGLGVGLSSGGQGGTTLDSNFCCPDWVNLMRAGINWNANLGVAGEVVIRFVVHRDGSITNVDVVKGSGIAILDLDAQRALSYAHLPPLPAAYEPDRLTITLTFPYIR